MKAWQEGRIVDGAAVWPADDRGALLGDGLFETLVVVEGRAPRMPRHLRRLTSSAEVLGIPCPVDLHVSVAEALRALHEQDGRPRRAVLRITLTRGRGRGLEPRSGPPNLVVTLDALADAVPGEPAAPFSAVILDAPRIDPRDPLAPHKTLSRMSRVYARMAARARGADVALLATIDGDVAEADAANVFVALDGVPVTPPRDRGILLGITRERCLAACAADGLTFVERPLRTSEVARAAEAFLTSSLDGIRPLSAVDGRQIVAPGPVAIALARALETGAA